MSRYGWMLGLAAMAAVTPVCVDGAEKAQGEGGGQVATNAPAPGTTLEATAQWKHLQATWAEASDIGAGKRGDYPFTEEEKQQLLENLKGVETDLTQLKDANLLTDSEVGLLRKDLTDVVAGVVAKRSKTVGAMATCYESVAMPLPAEASAQRLRDRLPLLEKLAGANVLHPAVVRKILSSVERDVAVLGDESSLARLPADQREKAREVYRLATREVQSIKKKLGDQAPATAPSGTELEK